MERINSDERNEQCEETYDYIDDNVDGDMAQRSHSGSESKSQQPNKQNCQIDAKLKKSIEMKLLMKKRMILEEEQRLTLEKEKLKLVQKGVSNFEGIECDSGASNSGVAQTPPRPKTRTKTKIKQKNLAGRPLYKRPTANYLPRFTMPCKFIMKKMQSAICRYTTDKKTRKKLGELVNLKIRLRINEALKDQPRYVLSKEIFNLYRSLYPKDTDDFFVKTVAKEFECVLGQIILDNQHTSEKKKPEQNWFIDADGEDNSANVNQQEVTEIQDMDNEFDIDFDPDDVEDWSVEDSSNSIQL